MGHFRWVGGGPPKKVAQNVLKHALVLEILSSDKFLSVGGGGGGVKNKSCSEYAETCSHFGIFEMQWFLFSEKVYAKVYNHHTNQIRRSALEAARLKIIKLRTSMKY